jgi:conjugative transposon TraM protein
MKKMQHPLKRKSQRRFLLVLPLLVIPFLTLVFYALGGGGTLGPPAGYNGDKSSLNVRLPDPHLKKGKEKDKLGLYEQAGRDSAKLLETMKNDPYYKLERHLEDSPEFSSSPLKQADSRGLLKNGSSYPGLNPTTGRPDSLTGDEKLVRKLEELKKALDNKGTPLRETGGSPFSTDRSASSGNQATQLEKMIRAINSRGGSDPEMEKIGKILDQVERIQHPEKYTDSQENKANGAPAAFEVRARNTDDPVSILENGMDPAPEIHNGFYGFSSDPDQETIAVHHGIRAVVDGSRVLVSGEIIRLRILDNITIGGIAVPGETTASGVATLSNERLKVQIRSIAYLGNILPVSLELYDLDGLPGIYIPGSMTREVSKETADQAISTLGLASLDPTIGAQAASAGIQAARTLLRKKIKLVRVTVKEGYLVLLKDQSGK